MNYKTHYDRLITRAQSRLIEGYVEKHHILPKCLGGTDDLENLVILTAEEHFVAHQLLIKIFPDCHKLVYAARMMCVSTTKQKRNNKLYGWIKKTYSEARKHIKHKPHKKSGKPRKVRDKETKPRKKRILSDEHRQKIGQAQLGRKRSEECRLKMSESGKGKTRSEEHKQKISLSNKGRKLSEEHKKAISLGIRKRLELIKHEEDHLH